MSDGARPVRDPHDGDFGGLDFRALSTLDGVVTFETLPTGRKRVSVMPAQAQAQA